MPLFRAIAGIGIAYLTSVAFLNAGIEAFTPYLARVRTLCAFLLAFVVDALFVLSANFLTTTTLDDFDGHHVFAVIGTTAFDGDFAAREVITSGFALVVILVTNLQAPWHLGYKLFPGRFINNFPATVFTIAFIPDVAELSPWALVAIAAMC